MDKRAQVTSCDKPPLFSPALKNASASRIEAAPTRGDWIGGRDLSHSLGDVERVKHSVSNHPGDLANVVGVEVDARQRQLRQKLVGDDERERLPVRSIIPPAFHDRRFSRFNRVVRGALSLPPHRRPFERASRGHGRLAVQIPAQGGLLRLLPRAAGPAYTEADGRAARPDFDHQRNAG